MTTSSNKRRVYEFPWPDRPNASMVVSYSWRTVDEFGLRVEPMTSFLVRDGWRAAEWCVDLGPIQIHHRCDELHPNSKPSSYIFPFIYDEWGNWSQMAVDEHDLRGKLARGDAGAILDVLAVWAKPGAEHPCPQCRDDALVSGC